MDFVSFIEDLLSNLIGQVMFFALMAVLYHMYYRWRMRRKYYLEDMRG